MSDRVINLKYIFLQGFYWMLYCVGAGFISFYLQGNGFNNSLIGIVTAIFCLVAVILQPIAGNICDRIEVLTWKRLIIILSIPYIIICIMMLLIKNHWTVAILFGLMYIITSINFGLARGCGSATYAILALIIGNLALNHGTNIIPVGGLIMIVLFLAIVIMMPATKKVIIKRDEERTNVIHFIEKYPYFSLMVLAVLFMFFSHNIVATYLLQIIQSLGGNSSNLGKAMFIQAVVEIPVLFTFSYIMKKVKVGNLMIIAAVGYVLKAVMYFSSVNIAMIYITQLSQICSFAILAAASVYFTGMVVDHKDQTTGQAFMSGMVSAGTVLGSLFGGAIIDHMGMRAMLSVNIFITIAGLFIAVCSVRLIRGRKKCEGV